LAVDADFVVEKIERIRVEPSRRPVSRLMGLPDGISIIDDVLCIDFIDEEAVLLIAARMIVSVIAASGARIPVVRDAVSVAVASASSAASSAAGIVIVVLRRWRWIAGAYAFFPYHFPFAEFIGSFALTVSLVILYISIPLDNFHPAIICGITGTLINFSYLCSREILGAAGRIPAFYNTVRWVGAAVPGQHRR
jgi:hypothetical protein